MSIENQSVNGEAVVELGRLCLDFGRVDRLTKHPDGHTLESDTDHTVMLGIVGCAFAKRYLPWLDLGLIAQYALVHDLVEVYAGDTPTLRINTDERQAKAEREAAAAERLRSEFSETLPWVPDTIDIYERRADPEARYVKALDKLLPKITHHLNNGAVLLDNRMIGRALAARYDEQAAELKSYGADFPPLFELREQLIGFLYSMLGQPPGADVHQATTEGTLE